MMSLRQPVLFWQMKQSMSYLHARYCRHKRTHHPRVLWLIFGLTADLRLWATRRLHGRARCAGFRFWAGDHGATYNRARRARTNLTRLITCADTRRAGGDRRLQNITRHVGKRRALRLQHVTRQVGLRRARWHRRL